ncbi:chromosome partitioning protein [Micromonospora sp. DT47]|uniref:MinD/ParA family ATP-binding protein n=1 Tax=Micromonospora sp. DT47 TaxID=3393431 RepID=UPI003CFB8C52
MVDENADRTRLPGQQPVPERDIEPLWPPDPTDPGPPGPAWAAHQSAAYPSLTAEVGPAPAFGGWAPPGDDGTAPRPDLPPDGPASPGPARKAGPVHGGVPVPRVGQPAPVDLDQPIAAPTPVDHPDATAAGHQPGPDTAPGTPVVASPVGARGESPWAQPPQRPSTGADEAVGTASVPGTGAATPPAPRLGPFPPSPGTPLTPPGPHPVTEYPPGPTLSAPPWQQGTPYTGLPQQPYPQQSAGCPDPTWTPEGGAAPTAEDFARRRQIRPADPVATMGVRAAVNRMGLVKLPPGRHEQELRQDIEMVRRNFGGLRQVTVVNPKGGAGKTVAILLLAMTFGQKRGGYVLAWDNNETQGTLGMRAQQDFHSRTVRDMLRDLGQFQGAHGRIGDLSQYVRSQGEGMFDVLASDESATGGEMLTAAAFAEIREVVSRFYKLIFVDTGNNVRAQNWQAAMDATDQLVVTMSARNDSAETAARMLDHLEQSGRQRLARQAVTVVSMPPSRKEIDLPAIQEHFAARTRAVLLAPYERLIDTGEPIRYGGLSSATRDAWLKIAAAVAEGL